MGSCFSSTAAVYSAASRPTAKVVTTDGSLIEYSTAVNVSEVLGSQNSVSSFLCNSDSLCYNDYIPILTADEILDLGQLYLILPIEKLKYTLSSQDMAALAVKASSAIAGAGKNRRRQESVQVMPMSEGDGVDEYKRINEFSIGNMSLKFAQKKIGRSSTPLRSSREKLSTIEEITKF